MDFSLVRTRAVALFLLQALLVLLADEVAGWVAAVFTVAGMVSGTAVALLLGDVVDRRRRTDEDSA